MEEVFKMVLTHGEVILG